MKGQDLMQAMNHIDMQYVNEAQAPVRRPMRRRVTVAVSAVLAAAVMTTTAGAVWKLSHPQTVETYLDSTAVQTLETQELVLNRTAENGYFRLTLETALSDGYAALVLFTVEPLNGEAAQLVTSGALSAELRYADGAREPIPAASSGCGYTAAEGAGKPMYADILLNAYDTSRPAELYFAAESPAWEGLSVTVELTPNVEVQAFSCEAGTVYLSPFELFSYNVPLTGSKGEELAVSLTLADGSVQSIAREGDIPVFGGYYNDETTLNSPVSYSLSFKTLLELPEVTEVAADGVRFGLS